MHKFWSILKFVCHFCHLMLCFKRKLFKKSIKIKSKFVLYGRFTPLTRPFFKFSILNFSSLAKNAKREIWRQKGDLRCKICNCIKCLALMNGSIFQMFLNLSQIGSNLRKFWENWVVLLKNWHKIGPTGIWMGHFFLKNWYLYGSTFKFRGSTSLPKPNLSSPMDHTHLDTHHWFLMQSN